VDLAIRHLRLVTAVAEHRSLTKAGDVLHLTQSALSHQLSDIEQRLGTKLFLRLNKRMVLTPSGERLLESARSVLTELDCTEDAIRNGLQPRPVPLRISTECYTTYHWLPAVLKPFKQEFPNVDVRIDAGSTRRPLTPLIEGKLDLALMTSPVRDARLAVRPLFEDEHVAIVAPGHRLAARPHLRPSDFREERLFTYVPRDESRFVSEILEPAGVLPASIEPVQLTEALIEMVKAGLGVAVLARWAVMPHVRDGSLRAVRVTAQGYYRHWHAAMPKHLADADYLTAFVRLLIEHAPRGTSREVLPFGRRRVAR
jgi:LysR family transcriptional regulator for metE and metH